MKTLFGVRYAIRRNKNKRKDYSVFARIFSNNSAERALTIKGSFQMEDWDDGKGWFNLTTKDLKEFATYLEKVKSKLTAIFQDLELKEGVLTAENIKNCYLGIDSSAGTFYLSERVAKWSFMIFALAGWAIR